MTVRPSRRLRAVAVAALAALSCCASASANPILMPTVQKEIQQQLALLQSHLQAPSLGGISLPAPPCPENGLLPSPLSNCGLPELPATTLPFPGNMSYRGGQVQVTPKVYLVYWGWGEPGAWPANTACTAAQLGPAGIGPGGASETLQCDPDGAGALMANFVQQLGGTDWAGVQTQCNPSGATNTYTDLAAEGSGLSPSSGSPI